MSGVSSGDSTSDRTWIEVDRTTSARDARERALMLEASGIPFHNERDHGDFVIAVPAPLAERARAELATFIDENVGWPPPRELGIPVPRQRGVVAAVAYSVAITYGYHLQTVGSFGLDWWTDGMAIADRILAGEWWRTITPLTLHSDPVHLAGNVVFGAIFVAGAAQALGNGAALLGIVLAGGFGNLINAIIQAPDHSSVGASTASFGAIGLLVAHLWRRRKAIRMTRQQRWTPLLVGIVLLGYLGTSGERTDVMAHITGFGCGAVFGAAAAMIPIDRLALPAVQRTCAAWAAGLVVIAWVFAHR